MKKLVYLLLLLPFIIIAQENDSYLLNMSEITVKQGHSAAFIQGVKAWKECYLENEGDDHWNMWSRMQGEGNVYVLSSTMANWAEFDDDGGDDASKECRSIVTNLIMPHVESMKYNIARSIPDWSSSLPEDTGLVWVTFFEVANSTDFRATVNAIRDALKQSNDERAGIWYASIGGDRHDADYFVSNPFSKFADLDEDKDSVWKVYENIHGKKKTDELRNKFRNSVVDIWSYIYTLNKELSN